MGGTSGHVIPCGNSILLQTRRWTIREKTKVVSYKGFCSFYTENGNKRQQGKIHYLFSAQLCALGCARTLYVKGFNPPGSILV